ncbi:hypothetical protein [Nonomuraea dietziae]|uniref:hypothetical protein n=1 Tax=Nonomuraea dietziae TaxID=65515 RepID=UPI0033E0A4A6
MLFRQNILEGIADGSVTLAFRRWKRCGVRRGSRLRTPVGVVEIDGVEEYAAGDVTPQDAVSAGYASLDALWKDLAPDGTLFRIGLHLSGPDPRTELRERSDLDAGEIAEVRLALDRIDRASRRTPWTADLLLLIRERPMTPAAVLAERLGRPTAALKRDVRRLKELGLTESLDVGYRLSARGETVARALVPTVKKGESPGGPDTP